MSSTDVTALLPQKDLGQSTTKDPHGKALSGQDLAETTASTSKVRRSSYFARKKLPWLEKQPLRPHEAAGLPSKDNGGNAGQAATSAAVPGHREASIHPLSNDIALRAIGSTPSLRQKGTVANSTAYSQRSQLPPGSKLSPMFVRRPESRSIPKTAYASSEYSAIHSSDGRSDGNASPNKAPELCEREGRQIAAPSTEHGGLPRIVKDARRGKAGLQPGAPTPPMVGGNAEWRGTRRPKPNPSLYRKRSNAPLNTSIHQRHKSCDDQVAGRKIRGGRTRPQYQRRSIPSHESSTRQSPVSRPLPLESSTLHSLPAHLMAASESSSPPSEIYQTPPATSVKPPARSILPFSGPILSTAGRTQPNEASGPLNRAVTGLENLMGEAISVARDAAQSGRPDEVANLLNEATLALRQASSVQSNLRQPLVLSPTASMRSSDSEQVNYSLNASTRSSREASAETVPTMFTKSSLQPLIVGHSSKPTGPTEPRSAGTGNRHQHDRFPSSPDGSISHTPPRLYPKVSAESVVRDFAYGEPPKKILPTRSELRAMYGAAASFYGDHGESVATQPGVRNSIAMANNQLPEAIGNSGRSSANAIENWTRQNHSINDPGNDDSIDPKQKPQLRQLRRVKAAPRDTLRSPKSMPLATKEPDEHRQEADQGVYFTGQSDAPGFMQSAYYRDNDDHQRRDKADHVHGPPYPVPGKPRSKASVSTGHPPLLISRNLSLKHPRRAHLSIQEEHGFSLGQSHKRQPIAREWNSKRKRITAMIACLNTIFIGLIAGIYAGEVPRIQYQLGDQSHWVILGNMLFFAGLGLSTLVFWPLPLLHGRKPYVLLAFSIILPLQIPQAVMVAESHPPDPRYHVGLLLPRALTGFALGFANINFLPTLWDLYGASLMSEKPHQEIVMYDDVRRQGGGIGVWLGIWTFCFSSSLSVGFCVGACVISKLQPSWGFYIIVLLLAIFLLINVITPETRRAPYRRSISHFFDAEDPEKIRRRVARGEVKLHVYNEGPKWWFEEVWAGLVLTKRMVFQTGFFVMMSYLGWIQAQLTLVILWVGLAALAVPVGAILAMPLTKASWFSRERTTPPRTDSMTFQPRFSWSTHLLRRIIFSVVLPLAGMAYCLTATGPPLHWSAVILFAGLVGFLTDLGIAECVGLIMETFDTCDLQPGVNTKHRLQSMSDNAKRRRTNYSAFPRVCAGFFAAQSCGFFLAAAATVAAGRVTNTYGTQTAVWSVAAILLAVTILLFTIMWRWKKVQVIPDYSGSRKDSKAPDPNADDPDWRPVVIGNPSGKTRRMNILEMGSWTRWTEIRKLNKLIRD